MDSAVAAWAGITLLARRWPGPGRLIAIGGAALLLAVAFGAPAVLRRPWWVDR